jgi:hypothetical protein
MRTTRALAVFGVLLLGVGLLASPAEARSKRRCRKLCEEEIRTCVTRLTACPARATVLPQTPTLPRTLEVACTREITLRCSQVTTRGGACFSPSGAFLDPELV